MPTTTSPHNVSLTVVLQPTQSVVPNETYLYDDALYDARGYGYSDYAGSPPPRENTLFLWESGCRNGDTWNCTLACADPKNGRNMTWSAPEAMFTLHNCFVYPVLATAEAHGWLVQDPSDLLDKFNIQALDILSTNSTSNSGDSSAWPVVNECLQKVCDPAFGYQAKDYCSGHDTSYTNYSAGLSDKPWRVNLVFDGTSGLCDMGIGSPNADLGGPGVMLSIIQQIAILAVMWLLLSSARWFRSALRVYSSRKHSRSLERIKEALAPGRQTSALIIALQEFQKTQIFLLLALQVVSLLALVHTTWLDAHTFPQLRSNAAFMVLLSTAGIYPIILGLLTLRKSKGHLEWFTLIVSLACVVVSLATWTKVSRIDLGAIKLQQDDLVSDECGGINPMRYCTMAGVSLRSYGISSQLVFRQRLSIGPVCVMLYLVVEKAISVATRSKMSWTPSWATNVLHAFRQRLIWVPSWIRSVSKYTVLLSAEAWLLWGNVMIFQLVYEIWAEMDYEGRVWTIGQVIGVGVWIPVFIEYLYSALRGIEANFSIRLPGNYKVIKSDKGVANSSHSDAARPIIPQSPNQQSSAMLLNYELLPNPAGDYHRVAQLHPWSPA